MLVIIFGDELSLAVDDGLQPFQLLLIGFHPLHAAVVNAPHADGEERVGALHLLQALGPILFNGAAVGDEVVFAVLFFVPLSHVVA